MNFAAGTTYHKGISFYLGELGELVDRGVLATLPPARLEVMRTRASALLGLVADVHQIATSPAAAAQLVQLQAGIGDKDRNIRDLIPEVVALARLVLPKAEGTNGGLLGLFGSVPGASQQLQVVKKFIRERLAISRDLLVRLKRVREQASGLEQLGRHDRAILQQIDEAVERQECLAASVETLDDAHAIDASHQATNHYLHASLLESVSLEHARLGPLLRDEASPVIAMAEQPPGNGSVPHEATASKSASSSYRPLWPEHFTVIPAWSRCNLVDYCAAFGVDLSEVDADSFKRAVGVTPRTIIGWSHSDNRPAKIGYVVALYRYLVESAWRQQEVEQREGAPKEPVELPDPMDLLRLVCGSWGDPFFTSHVMNDPQQVIVPIPYQIADIPADRISYGPVLRRIRETIAPSAQDDINWLLQGYHRGAITGDTFQDHAKGRVNARARTRKSRDTVRVFLGDSFNFFLEIQPYLRAVGVLTEVPSRRMFGELRHSQYRIRLVPDQVAVDWASVRPRLEPDQAPYAYYLDGRMTSFVAWLRQRMEFMREILGWQGDWPVTINGLKLQTFGGLEATLEELSGQAVVESKKLSSCLEDPSQITPRTETDAYELTRRILRFHRSLETIAVLGHVTHGPLAIDYRFVGSSEAAVARAWQTEQGYMVALDPGPLIQKWLSGEISNERTGQLFHYRVVREAMRARLSIRDQPGDFFDEALCKFLFPDSKKRDLASLLKCHQAWTQAAKGEGIDPLCLDPFALQVLERMAMSPRRTSRPVGKTSLVQQITKYFFDNYGVRPANAEPLVTGLQTYLDTEGSDHFADGCLLGMLATLFTEDEITSWKPVFLDLLAYLGFPNGDAELAAKIVAEPATETAVQEVPPTTVTIPGQLSRWLETYLIRQGQAGDANLCWLRFLAQQSADRLLAGELPDVTAVEVWERDFQTELTQTLGLAVTPGLGLPFLQAMARELSRVNSDNFPVDEEGIESSEALTTIQRRLMADEISDVPELLSMWLSEILEQALRLEQQLLEALRETSNAKTRDQVGWRDRFFNRVVRLPGLGMTANWEDVLRRHESRMELLHPGHPSLVGKNMGQALGALPEVYIPELASIPGCQQALVAYAAARGEGVTVEALAGRIRRFSASAPDEAARGVIALFRQARLASDEIRQVATEVLRILGKTIKRITPESEAFNRAQRALYEGLEQERREAENLFASMDTLLDLVAGEWASQGLQQQEDWQDLLIRMGRELEVANFPANWAGWGSYLEDLELRAILAGRSNPLAIRQRVAVVLETLLPRRPAVDVPASVWRTADFQALDEAAYALFWRELLEQIPNGGSGRIVVYLDDEMRFQTAFLDEESFDRLGGILQDPTRIGYLKSIPLRRVTGEEFSVPDFHIRFGMASSLEEMRRVAQWAVALSPSDPSYHDVQFAMQLVLRLRGIASETGFLDHLGGHTGDLPLSLRTHLNEFYRSHRVMIDNALAYHRNLGFCYISDGLRQHVEQLTADDPGSRLIIDVMLMLPFEVSGLPESLTGPLSQALRIFESGQENATADFDRAMLALWPQVRRHCYGRHKGSDELQLVGRVERQILAEALEAEFRTPGLDPDKSLAFARSLEILRTQTDSRAARALVRILDPAVVRHEPPYVQAFVRMMSGDKCRDLAVRSEAVGTFYQKRRAELLWRLREELGQPDFPEWMADFLPEDDQMPPRFSLSHRFPELEALTVREVDTFRDELLEITYCARQGTSCAEFGVATRGIVHRILIPMNRAITYRLRGTEMTLVGVRNEAGERLYFRDIIRASPAIRLTIPDEAVSHITLVDIQDKTLTIQEGEVSQACIFQPGVQSIPQANARLLQEYRLSEIHPMMMLLFATQADANAAHLQDPTRLEPLLEMMNWILNLSDAKWQKEETMTEIRNRVIRFYQQDRPRLKNAGLHPRFAELIS